MDKKALGVELDEDTGFQLLLTSNEGFPDAGEVLSRKVNEYEGQHRFGGGSDYAGDPHFMDILWPPAEGTPEEIDGQHAALSNYVSSADPSENIYVQLPMVYRGSDTGLPEPATRIPRRLDTRTIGFESPIKPVDTIQAGDFQMKISGKIYTQWLYGNDVSESSVYIDPFGDGGHNGINSELELNIHARVSDYAEAGARIKNRFRNNFWSTYWNNDNLDEAQYMKLRGVWVRFQPPEWLTPFIQKVHIGSSDLGMFSPWTVGRIRYIDRDNAMGTFVSGQLGSKVYYDAGRISLPEPWAGPGWSTRGKGYFSADGFAVRDFAYAAAFNIDLHDRFKVRFVGDYTRDVEGDPDDEVLRDGVDREVRYENTVLSVEFESSPLDFLDFSGVFAHADSNYEARFDYIEKKNANPIPQKDLDDTALKLLLEMNDPFAIGLSFAFEYFNIGENYVTLMGARRETDVLLTEGFEADDAVGAFDWGGWWGTMGQVPSLSVDNADTQFNETCYQTVVGWKGLTSVVAFQRSALDLTAEYTFIDYNTNMQNRDMTVYWEGAGFLAPDNAYNEYQERETTIAVLKGSFAFQAGKSWNLSFRIKNIDDEDKKNLDTPEDDYTNDKWIYDLSLGCRVFDEIYLLAGYTLYDKDVTWGGVNYNSEKNRYYFQAKYDFGGVRIGYAVENYTGEDWEGEIAEGTAQKYDDWDLVRSHAFLEVAF